MANLQRRQFTELHPKDQTIKLNRKARIESNWSCNVQDCLPLHIRPRMELKKGAKARVGDIGVSEEIWWNWSVELLRSLEELSTMTATKLPFAQELLHLEVTQRQQNPKHPQRKIVELLLGDVQRVIDGMRRNQQQQNQSAFADMGDSMEDADAEYGGEDYDDAHEAQALEEGGSEHADMMMTENGSVNGTGHTPQQEGSHAAASNRSRYNSEQTFSPPQPAASRRPDHAPNNQHRLGAAELEVRSVEIRARAMRLRSQATRLEASAVELEADAADLRARMREV